MGGQFIVSSPLEMWKWSDIYSVGGGGRRRSPRFGTERIYARGKGRQCLKV